MLKETSTNNKLEQLSHATKNKKQSCLEKVCKCELGNKNHQPKQHIPTHFKAEPKADKVYHQQTNRGFYST